jgi:putative nucleotidyltransferase with HDIG domain
MAAKEMFNRIKQVFAALTATVTQKDKQFVDLYLDSQAQQLFWGMNLPDQRHVLNVAYTSLKFAESHPKVNCVLLIRCALLHDVGKRKGDVSTIDKIITVIGYWLLPSWSKEWGRLGRGSKLNNLRHAFYIYYHHANRSAIMLQGIGESRQVVEIVAKHHKTPADSDPLELILLRKADSMH